MKVHTHDTGKRHDWRKFPTVQKSILLKRRLFAVAFFGKGICLAVDFYGIYFHDILIRLIVGISYQRECSLKRSRSNWRIKVYSLHNLDSDSAYFINYKDLEGVTRKS